MPVWHAVVPPFGGDTGCPIRRWPCAEAHDARQFRTAPSLAAGDASWTPLRGRLLGLSEQLPQIDLQRLRYPDQGGEPAVLASLLNSTVLGAMHPNLVGKCLLTHA